ncbi:Major surface antigen 4 precursor [Anaplasma phagocytophilum]|uniref:Major surface antigen 4 n=1 Tax=Anaplasma phagocytophilum TaxID=948 RepID=A0AA45UTR2_ANAPH|nr:P44/Msp2 family outer membrane protein [Anaplasma phagocytophilum]SBO14843.1 Major surface antigen 4 precursor [Anaplasma phagocytophilum]
MRTGMFLRSAVMSLVALMASQGVQAHDAVSAVDTGEAGYFYVGLDYSPAFSGIRDFSIRDSGEKASAVYPYLNNGDIVKLESNRFDWNAPNPRIRFQDNMLVAMEGSVGYGIGNARVELEVGYERFKIRGSVGREDKETDAIYLLARGMAYDILSMRTESLAAALAKLSGKDIVNFAKAVEISYPEIDSKVCRTKEGTQNGYGEYYSITQCQQYTRLGAGHENNHTSLCGGVGGNGAGGYTPQHLKHFVNSALGYGIRNWPTSTSEVDADYQPVPNDNAEALAKDLIQELTPEEKTIVAGLLAKTIKGGGGVIEIKAISSASVVMNVCSDILVSNIVMPYACVGSGMSFIGVVDGHTTAKFAYRLKAGLSYKLSKEVTAFAGGFYHHVVGDGVYEDLPLRHLADDISLAEHAKDTAIASFDMSYVGGEFGVRLAF